MALGLSRVHPACRMKSLLLFYILYIKLKNIKFFFILVSPTLSLLVVANPDSSTKITLENAGQAAIEFDRKDFCL